MVQGISHGSHTIRVKNDGFGVAGKGQYQTSQRAIDVYNTARLTTSVPFQNRLHRLDHGHGVAVGEEVIVGQILHLPQPFRSIAWKTAELHKRHLLEKAPESFYPITALGSLAPWLQKRCVVMMVGRDLEIEWRSIFHG